MYISDCLARNDNYANNNNDEENENENEHEEEEKTDDESIDHDSRKDKE